MIRVSLKILAAVALLGLIACAQQLSRQADGGMTGTGSPLVTIGTVTKFGSVVVNGIEWNSDRARVVVNGKPATIDSGLHLGMIVRVEGRRDVGSDNRGWAETIQYESDLIGPVNRASLQTGQGMTTLLVAGQPVVADRTTLLEGVASLAALADGDQLEISGYRDRFYGLHATWIRKVAENRGLVRVKGIASDVTDTSFKVENLTVRYGNELALKASSIRPGTFVSITGKLLPGENMSVQASDLGLVSIAVALPEDVPVIMEGLIKSVSQSGFTMHNRTISVGSTTTFERGAARDLHEDGKVHVIGRFKKGVFDATKIIIAATN